MKKKFLPEYKYLIIHYAEEIRKEQEQAKELNDLSKK